MTPRVPIEDRKLITRLFSEGLKQKAICQRTGRSKTSVSRIIRAFRDEGRITDAKRTGRPRATQHTDDELIVAAVVVDPLLNAKEIRHELSLDISTATIRRRLEEAGISNCAPGKKPFRTEQQRKQRLKSAKESQLWSAEERRVHFSDESTSCSWGDEQRMVRMPSCSR
ncbi:hypothetical protein HPB48_010206 [Haemaphysalis longicornis]|uniref:Transposase Tc1-like domain-containing protein n=1 Tax=Haemaphysalis longicornis TaxID=44386 RepID=A0A9J6H3W6_HAELO|nr:hypothetical protein HPB48_010206 [Haemaphysalis longicornis]